MTLMSSISKLTTSVDQLTREANVTKAALDAQVAQVDAEVVAAQAEQAATEAARDEAATNAATADTHLATVKAGVTYQGISALLAEKAVTAVDVFVYDTSLDSDGGAWRKRCQHTSWYNEELNTATRGARREFPAVAVIVLEAGKLTVYDGDDHALPMWREMTGAARTFNNSLANAWWIGSASAKTVSALDGKLCAGQGASTNPLNGGGLFVFDLLGDFVSQRWRGYGPSTGFQAASVADFTSGAKNQHGLPAIISEAINDVAMTVLPDAPIDHATGLQVPTIAVATDGGVSVIKDDGAVVSATDVSGFANHNTVKKCDVFGDRLYLTAWNGTQQNNSQVFGLETLNPRGRYTAFDALYTSPTPFSDPLGVTIGQVLKTPTYLALGSSENPSNIYSPIMGLGLIAENEQDTTRGLSALTTSSYTTGWMPGDIKGAFISDTDDTDLIGGDAHQGFSAYTEVGTGTFSSGGQFVDTVGGQVRPGVVHPALVSGQPYVLTVVIDAIVGATQIRLDGLNQADHLLGVGTHTISFTASGTPLRFRLEDTSTSINDGFTLGSVSIEEADADRSVNNNGLIVNGTITRSPVADGAELVGYSGFSATNYLEQPYNSALDFGTGDFCVMGWITRSAASDWLVDRLSTEFDGSGDKSGFWVWQNGDQIRFDTFEDGASTAVLSTTSMANGPWYMFAALREEGVLKLYVNGVLDASNSIGFVRNIDPGAWMPPVLAIGARRSNHAVNSAPWLNGKAALIRISATAPTADQIRRIYEDERKLFMPGAQCTLYGTSDAVTALAHDPKTNLLHVGTSAGRSIFDGLQRVANTETPVTTAISAVNGLIAEQ